MGILYIKYFKHYLSNDSLYNTIYVFIYYLLNVHFQYQLGRQLT